MHKFAGLLGMMIILFSSPLSATAASSPLSHPAYLPNAVSPQQATALSSFVVKKKKLSFIQRIIFKMTQKKIRKMMRQGKLDADKLARQSNLFGWLSLLALFIFPIASIPLGILAIVNGRTALENGTSLTRKARTGTTTGIIALSLVILILVIVIVSLSGMSL